MHSTDYQVYELKADKLAGMMNREFFAMKIRGAKGHILRRCILHTLLRRKRAPHVGL